LGPSIAESLGFYWTPQESKRLGDKPASYFYKDDDADIDVISTLYHEVSHQLLFESTPCKYDSRSNNYWVMEGLGTYFETVSPQPDGSILVGGVTGPRIGLVQVRLFKTGTVMPIEKLVAMGQRRFRGQGEDVHENYQAAMALTVFLMQYDGGRYRDSFLDYVESVYRGRLKGNVGRSLEDRLGVPFKTLEQQFMMFLRTANQEAEAH
jgi:hypothetical protein